MWNVIAADDEGYIREALKKLIDWQKMDCQLVAVLSDGQALAEQIQKEKPDIVITDIQMPGMNGLEVCRYINEVCPETQIILLTAYSDFQYAKEAIKYNVCAYVLKISIMDELPAAVEKAAAKRSLYRGKKQNDEMDAAATGSLVRQVEAFIEQNYKKRISLDDIAASLHVNRSYLSRTYKSKTGVNLFDAILYRRIDAAKEYLLNTDMKTYEVSEAVGVEDAGYFSKMFKKIVGVSPKEYRKGQSL